MEEAQFNKLPKWAQSEITRLTRNLEYAEQQINQINGKTGTNTFLYDSKGERPLPADSTVRFRLSNGTIDVEIRDNKILLHGNSNLTMNIQPRVSNAFYVAFSKEIKD